MAPSDVLRAALSSVTTRTGRKVDDIVDAHCIALVVSKDDESRLAQENKVRALQIA